MKKILLISVALMTLFASCKKGEGPKGGNDNGGGTQEVIEPKLEVTDIANNQATITVTLVQGNFYGGKIVEAINEENVGINYDDAFELVQYVVDNGTEISSLPYTKTLENVKKGRDKFTAVLLYNSKGIPYVAKYAIWTPDGVAYEWSETNTPGSLGEIEW